MAKRKKPEDRPMRVLVPIKDGMYIDTQTKEKIPVSECLCGVMYHPRCPLSLHRHYASVERAECINVKTLSYVEEEED